VVLALYTYQAGLRAPALIAVVKDTLIYATILVAVIVIPSKLGGFGHIFHAAGAALPKKDPPGALVPGTADAQIAYATLAVGSALALFLYPHALTGVLSASSARVIRRNATILPAYTFLLGLIALLGYMAIAAKIDVGAPNEAVPALFAKYFPSWVEGVAFAAIAIGALVPAAVMSIAAANLFSRNVYKEFIRRDATDAQESQVAKVVSLVVKLGALLFIILVPTEYAIDFQLLGGVWILQTVPAIIVGLYTRWFDRRALLAGWAVGMAAGTLIAATNGYKPAPSFLGTTAYTGMWAFAFNLVVAVVGTLVLRAVGSADDRDETRPEDFDELDDEALREGRFVRDRQPERSLATPGTR
jgi:solute:Na+ symporter, SSS family